MSTILSVQIDLSPRQALIAWSAMKEFLADNGPNCRGITNGLTTPEDATPPRQLPTSAYGWIMIRQNIAAVGYCERNGWYLYLNVDASLRPRHDNAIREILHRLGGVAWIDQAKIRLPVEERPFYA